jgi:hypothetical protein
MRPRLLHFCTGLLLLIFISVFAAGNWRVENVRTKILDEDEGLDSETWVSSNDLDTPTAQAENVPGGTQRVNADGLPIVATGRNGKVVMLTGASGPGHFSSVPEFYNRVIQNRMEYAAVHGTSPKLPW